jgi:excisionase family DNA binding protein
VTAQPTAPGEALAQALERLAADARTLAGTCEELLAVLPTPSLMDNVDAATNPRCKTTRRPAPGALLTPRELAAMLQVDARTLRSLRHAGSVPKPVMIGRLPRWRRDAIQAWLNNKEGG